MALTKKQVEGWQKGDAHPLLCEIRDDVLALMEGAQVEVEALSVERVALLKALADKDVEMGALRTERDAAQAALAEVTADRDALAGRVLEVEEMIAAEEDRRDDANSEIEP